MWRWAVRTALVVCALGAAAVAVFWWASDDPLSPVPARWDASVGVLAGGGAAGWRDGIGLRAQFTDPAALAAGRDGLIYVGDDSRIRVVDGSGEVATLAGGQRGFADGRAHDARFGVVSGMTIDRDGSIYVTDTSNNSIRRVTAAGDTQTIAGTGVAGFLDGAANQALFNGPIGIALDRDGRIVVADTYNDRLRVVTPDGTVATLAGGARGFADGRGGEARFNTPTGLALDAQGTIYVADTGNDSVRAVAPDGSVSTVIDTTHGLYRPLAVASAATGELYVATEDGRLLERASDGTVRVLAGSRPGFRDGAGAESLWRRPSGIAWLAPGELAVADGGNAMIRRVAAATRTSLVARPSPLEPPQFDAAAFSLQPLLWPSDPMDGPFEVAGTMGEARGEDAGRFHAGLDVRVEQGREVLVVREGVVRGPLGVSSFGTINESIRAGSLAYVHVRAGRTREGRVTDLARFVPTYDESGRLVDVRVKRGARFETGDVIGTVNQFNHVHLNVGWPGDEYNPLQFRLAQFRDSIAPTIAPRGIQLFASNGARFTAQARRRLLVSGDVRIVVDAWDQADGNRPNRRLGLFELGYQVLSKNGRPVPGFELPRMTIRFDRLGDPQAPGLVFASGSGIPFYGERRTRFLYVVTNSFRNGIAAAGMWRTSELAPGDYTVRIHARDASGNEATANRDLAVTIAAAADQSR